MYRTAVLLLLPSLLLAEPARPADEFVQSIGVNTHFHFTDTKYYTAYAQVRDKLTALGVRHIRDHNSTTTTVIAKLQELHNSHGIGIMMRADGRPGESGAIRFDLLDAQISNIRAHYADAVDAIEGPNEFDLNGNGNYADLAEYTRQMYLKIKADAVLKDKPVVLTPMGWTGRYPLLGDMSAHIDYANMHPYPGGKNPSSDIQWHINQARSSAGTKPLYCTETGYHNAINTTSTHKPTTESAEGKYIPRLFMVYFKLGIRRTYDYQLIDHLAESGATDSERQFGLLANDLREKPAYVALKHTIALLTDSGPQFPAGSLTYSLTGDTAGLQHLLFQKRNGTFFLVLWQEVRSYDEDARVDLVIPRRSCTLVLSEPASQTRLYEPLTSIQPIRTLQSASRIDVSVPDHLLIVEIDHGQSTETMRLSPASTCSAPGDHQMRVFAPWLGLCRTAAPGFSLAGRRVAAHEDAASAVSLRAIAPGQ